MDRHSACLSDRTIPSGNSESRSAAARLLATSEAPWPLPRTSGRTRALKTSVRSARARSLRVSRTEMLQHHQIFAIAAIFDRDAVLCRLRADEYFVFRHFTETNEARRFHFMLAEDALPLGYDHAIRGGIFHRHGGAGKYR